jgi:amino acid transporter
MAGCGLIVKVMQIGPKREATLWLIGVLVLMAPYFFGSNQIQSASTVAIFALITSCLFVPLLWMKFRKRDNPAPTWLKVLATCSFFVAGMLWTISLLGWAAWYK